MSTSTDQLYDHQSFDQLTEPQSSINQSNESPIDNHQPIKKRRKHRSKPSVHFDELSQDQQPDRPKHSPSYQNEEKSSEMIDNQSINQMIDNQSLSQSSIKQRKNKPKRSSDHVPFSNSTFKRPYGNASNHYQSTQSNQSIRYHPNDQSFKAQFVSSPQPFTAAEIADQKARRKSWLKQTEKQLAQVHQNARAIKARESKLQLVGLIGIWLIVIAIIFWFVFRSINQPANRPSVKRIWKQSVNPAYNHSQWWT